MSNLPPIKGVAYPRWHTAWCNTQMHHANWKDIIESGYDDDPPPCRRNVAGGYLPTIHRCDPPIPATRAGQEPWAVVVEQVNHVLEDNRDYVDDPVIVLERDRSGESLLRLLPGEARELAAALIRAADIEMFSETVR